MSKKVYVSQQQQYIDAAIGFTSWYLLNGLVWLLFGGYDYGWLDDYGTPNLLLFPLNAILLIIFLVYRRWIGLGILGALALNLIVALVIGVLINGACAVPFWIPTG